MSSGASVARETRSQGVVPVRADGMSLDIQAPHDRVRHFETLRVRLIDKEGFDLQAGRSARAAQTGQQDVEGAQGHTRPVDADRTEQAMLNRIPLGRTRRIMADVDFQAQAVG